MILLVALALLPLKRYLLLHVSKVRSDNGSYSYTDINLLECCILGRQRSHDPQIKSCASEHKKKKSLWPPQSPLSTIFCSGTTMSVPSRRISDPTEDDKRSKRRQAHGRGSQGNELTAADLYVLEPEQQKTIAANNQPSDVAPGAMAVSSNGDNGPSSRNKKRNSSGNAKGRNGSTRNTPVTANSSNEITVGSVFVSNNIPKDEMDSSGSKLSHEGSDSKGERPFTIEATLVQDTESLTDREKLKEEVRKEYLKEVPLGEAIKVEDIEPTQRSSFSKLVAVGIGLCLLIVGIVLGVVLKSDDNDNETSTVAPVPVTATPTVQPTWSPTVSIANLNNSLFDEAHPLTLGEVPRLVPFSRSTMQTFSIDCGALSMAMDVGLWYSYEPKVSAPVTVVACGNGTSIMVGVPMGTDSIGCLLDFVANGDVGECGGDSLTWEAKVGQKYQIFVRPPQIDAEDLLFTEGSIELVDNDECHFAYGPINATSVGAVNVCNTKRATQEDLNVPACGGASEGLGPGVWYKVQGTGGAITADTCSENTNFDTQISVFRGSCNGLECVNGNNDYCGKQSQVIWASEKDEFYYVYVHGTAEETGDFELTLTRDYERPANDFCETAEEIKEESISSVLSGSTADPDAPICASQADNVVSEFPYGVWYKVVGTGGAFSVDVTWVNTSPNLNLYVGSCGNLQCADVVMQVACVGSGVVLQCTSSVVVESSIEGEIYNLLLSTTELTAIDTVHGVSVTHY